MTVEIRGQRDPVVERIGRALESYSAARPKAKIALYRQNPAAIRVRIIDPGFSGMSLAERNDNVWDWLQSHWKGPNDDLGDISMLLLLTPGEVRKSFANMEFEDPVPSGL